ASRLSGKTGGQGVTIYAINFNQAIPLTPSPACPIGRFPQCLQLALSLKTKTMSLILPVKGISPVFGNNCYLAPNATIVGDVVMGDDCSVWFNAVVRGDVHWIRIGNRVNIQDGAIIHCTYQKAP